MLCTVSRVEILFYPIVTPEVTNLSQFVWDSRVSQNTGLSDLKLEQSWANQDKLVTFYTFNCNEKLGVLGSVWANFDLTSISHLKKDIRTQSITASESQPDYRVICCQLKISEFQYSTRFKFCFSKTFEILLGYSSLPSTVNRNMWISSIHYKKLSNSSASQVPCTEFDTCGRVLLTLFLGTQVWCGES